MGADPSESGSDARKLPKVEGTLDKGRARVMLDLDKMVASHHVNS